MLVTLLALAALVATPAHAGHGHGHDDHRGQGHDARATCNQAARPAAQPATRPAARPAVRPAARAGVTVYNRTGRSINLYADGVFIQSLAPGASELRVNAGDVSLSARVDGRTIQRFDARLAPNQLSAWSVDAPRLGAVLVRNPLPIAVRVIGPDGVGRHIEAYGQLMLSGLPVGEVGISMQRLSGQPLDARRVEVSPWSTASVRVRPPSTGVVLVDNDFGRGLRIFVDGRPTSWVNAGGELAVELSPGAHRIDLVDDGGRYAQTVQSYGVDVDVYSPTRIDVGPPAPQRPARVAHASGGRAEVSVAARPARRP